MKILANSALVGIIENSVQKCVRGLVLVTGADEARRGGFQGGAEHGISEGRGKKKFFFEKKNQKTFVTALMQAWVLDGSHASLCRRKGKSFLVLFFKKELLF